MRARVCIVSTTCLALLATSAASGAANPTAQESYRPDSVAEVGTAATPMLPARPATARPRIGLVLGGGGAKGAAHVGVLTLLEDMRIPIDCVVGTSMGALVGGTYAAGSTAAELEKTIRAISWSETIAFEGRREKLPIRRKLAGATYSNSLEFGFRDGSLAVPKGFINTQNIEQTIRYLVARSLGVTHFDDLPIPFRAIATDMQTGDMVVLDQGDLAQAMRASMSVPGVFAPVQVDGRILGDGGLTRNVPVDIARQTCADVVIAVAVPTPTPTPEQLQSPLSMIERTLDVLIGANEKQQLETLGPADVKIIVPMGPIGSGSFDMVAESIPLGRSAAEEHRDELRRYALPEAEYRAWLEHSARPDARSLAIADIEISGVNRTDEAYVRAELGLKPGEVVEQRDLSQAMNRLFDLDDFDSVQYSLVGDPERPSLHVDIVEKSTAPNILRFDIGLSIGTSGGNAFVFGAEYLRPWVNARGGEVYGQVQFGRTSIAQVSLYQPLDRSHDWFVEPGARIFRSTEDIFFDGDAATRYDFDGGFGSIDVGRVFGASTELRAGLRSGFQSAQKEIADPFLPEVDAEGYGGVAVAFTYDDRDSMALATRGTLSRVRYYQGTEALGSVSDYDRIEGLLQRSFTLGNNVVQLRVTGGGTTQGELPFYDLFTLGGPLSFPGLSLGQLRGTSYWTGSAGYLHKIADISALFGQSLYAGVQLTAGDMAGRIDGVNDAPAFSASFLLGGRTPLGPLTLSIAATTSNEWNLLFGLGRPIEERNITDPVW
jgi:NTE family protein